jgi:hypothetical protein
MRRSCRVENTVFGGVQLIAEIGIEYRIQMGYWTTLQKDQELSLPSVIKAVM